MARQQRTRSVIVGLLALRSSSRRKWRRAERRLSMLLNFSNGSVAAGRSGRTYDRNSFRRVFGRITDAALDPLRQSFARRCELTASAKDQGPLYGPTRACCADVPRQQSAHLRHQYHRTRPPPLSASRHVSTDFIQARRTLVRTSPRNPGTVTKSSSPQAAPAADSAKPP